MLKIMILDDEALPRIALRNIASRRYEVVGEAATGESGVEMALRLRPDIVLVDIVLPDFDGFTFIERVAKELPDTRYLIISNVENVEYLKKALKNRVYDYLIKGTVTEESLLQVLISMEEEMRPAGSAEGDGGAVSGRAAADAEGAGNGTGTDGAAGGSAAGSGTDLPRLLSALEGSAPADPDLFRQYFHFQEGNYYCIHFRNLETEKTGKNDNILRMIEEILMDSGDGGALQLSGSRYFCVFFPPEEEDGAIAAHDLAYRVIETLRGSLGIAFSCGISGPVKALENVSDGCLASQTALERCFTTGAYSINVFSEYDSTKSRRDVERLKTMVRNGLAGANASDVRTLLSLLEDVKDTALTCDVKREFIIGLYYDVVYYALSTVSGEGDANYARAESLISRFSTARTLKYLHKTAVDALTLLDGLKAVPGNESAIVREVKDYIAEHISEQLSLEEIAAHVYINPTYLSQMFRKKTGEKLRRYIISERIRCARKYLENDRSIHETALLTGFVSDSYFIQCFKDQTGFTPREYIRNHHLDCC